MFPVKTVLLLPIWLLCFAFSPLQAGDAVALGYNAEGIWMMVTYYCSSSPPGGADYKDSAQAREAALRDLRKRLGADLAKASVIADSDLTSYAAVARGQTKSKKDVTVVGYGSSQAQADKKALIDLKDAGATAKRKIVYRYFSYGADFPVK